MNPRKRLLALTKRGYFREVKKILENSNLDRSLDTFGAALLRYSAKHGNGTVLRYLTEKGCNVDARDSKGRTALMRALQGKHHGVIKSLLLAGASTTILDNENKGAVHIVCNEHELSPKVRFNFLHKFREDCSSSENAAEKLIEAGCQLYQAIYSGDARIVEYMLEHGFSTDSMIPRAKVSALHIATLLENVEIVRLLLKFGADLKAQDLMGYTPLYYVYRCTEDHSVEKLEILKMLVGEDVTMMDLTQISLTLTRGNFEAVRYVLLHIDFGAEDEKQCNLLHLLSLNSNSGVAKELRSHSDKIRGVNAPNEAGLTPLHLASINGNVEMVEFLLDHGANVNQAGVRHGRTALYYAYAMTTLSRENQYDRCVEILLQQDADPRFVGNEMSGEQVTVIDAAMESKCARYERLEPVIAKLTLIEKLGMPIPEVTQAKIDECWKLKLQQDKYRRLLEREIHGNVTLLKLLSASEKKLEKYAGNKVLVLKLKRIGCMRKVRHFSSYFCNILTKRFTKASQKRRLTDVAAGGVCKIFGGRVDGTHIVVSRVSDYLNEQDLQKLCQL